MRQELACPRGRDQTLEPLRFGTRLHAPRRRGRGGRSGSILAAVRIAVAWLVKLVVLTYALALVLAVYVFLGMMWAFTFAGMAHIQQDPFFAQSVTPTSAEFLYFSFVTQTTVGYGDLSPQTIVGRTVVVRCRRQLLDQGLHDPSLQARRACTGSTLRSRFRLPRDATQPDI